MMMSAEEIDRSYRLAKKKKGQIAILAQLNACSQDHIREILNEQAEKKEAERQGKEPNVDRKAEKVEKNVEKKPARKSGKKDILDSIRERAEQAERDYIEIMDRIGVMESELADIREKAAKAENEYKFICEVKAFVEELAS